MTSAKLESIRQTHFARSHPHQDALCWSTPFRSATELTECLGRLGKSFHAVQLSHGPLKGWFSAVHLGSLSLLTIHTDQQLLLHGDRGHDFISFCLEATGNSADHRVHCEPISPHSLHGFKEGLQESFFQLTAGSTSFLAVTSNASFNRFLSRCGQEQLRDLLTMSNSLNLQPIQYQQLVDQMWQTLTQPPQSLQERRLIAETFYVLFLECLLQQTDEQVIPFQTTARQELVRELVRWGFRHPTTSTNLDVISSILFTSRRTLILGAKENVGMGPMELLRSIRMEQANWLLRSKAAQVEHDLHSVSEIANHYGFHSRGNFAAIYRQHFAETPRKTFQTAA